MSRPVLEIVPAGPLSGVTRAPASKSVTNRLVLMAALARGTSQLRGPLASDDSTAMRNVLTGLGATIVDHDEDPVRWSVTGVDGLVAGAGATIDCRLSGTAIRFGTAAAALSDTPLTVSGQAPLLRRPIAPLVRALQVLGASAQMTVDLAPVTIGGGLDGGQVTLDASGSSQFVSAILLAAPYARTPVDVVATGSFPTAYVELTVQAMGQWGASVISTGPRSWRVDAGRGYTAQDVAVEYDASGAAHLFALAIATGGSVTVTGTGPTVQPDATIIEVFRRFGASIDVRSDRITVVGPARPVALGAVDLSAMPDQVTSVAALAALADGTTTITGTEVVRGHETDRLDALATELAKLGTAVVEHPDGLTIDGAGTRGHAALDTYHDHRLAMAFASVGVRFPGVRINDPDCVAKTFPTFWDTLVALGGTVQA